MGARGSKAERGEAWCVGCGAQATATVYLLARTRAVDTGWADELARHRHSPRKQTQGPSVALTMRSLVGLLMVAHVALVGVLGPKGTSFSTRHKRAGG